MGGHRDFLAGTALGSATLLAVWTGQAVAGPAFNWSGAYVGGSLGGAFPLGSLGILTTDGISSGSNVYFNGNTPFFGGGTSIPPGPAGAAWPTKAKLGANDLLATLNGGYSFQAGNIVYGIELEASLFARASSTFSSAYLSSGRNQHLTVSGGLESMFSARPRVGVAIDRLLLFGTGGLAIGHASIDTAADYTDEGKSAGWQGHSSGWRLGFVAGAGAEYALTDRVSLKFEGLYYNLGSISAVAKGTGSGTAGIPPMPTALDVAPYTAKLGLSGEVIRAGINLHF